MENLDKLKKPGKKDFGYVYSVGFDDDQAGWMFEEGEEKYYEALKIYEKTIKKLTDEKEKT